MTFDRYKGFARRAPVDEGIEVPAILWGSRGWNGCVDSSQVDPTFRIQWASDRGEESGVGTYDENDFLVHPSCTPQDDSSLGRLYEARLFLAFLLALRRTALFSADLCERTYNIWLPPALFEPIAQPKLDGTPRGTLSVFPFVTLVRRPRSQAWRHSFSLSAIIVPTTVGADSNRSIGPAEVGAVVMSLDGPSVRPSSESLVAYRELGGSLPGYLGTASRRAGFDRSHQVATDLLDRPHAPLRQWFGAVLLTAALSQEQGSKRRHDERDLASDVLTAVRRTGFWSVLIDSQQFPLPDPIHAATCAGTWWPVRHGCWRAVDEQTAINSVDRPMRYLDVIRRGKRIGARPTDRVRPVRFGRDALDEQAVPAVVHHDLL